MTGNGKIKIFEKLLSGILCIILMEFSGKTLKYHFNKSNYCHGHRSNKKITVPV
jgi:hypothetical protein